MEKSPQLVAPLFLDFSDIPIACGKAEYGFLAFPKPPYLNPSDKTLPLLILICSYSMCMGFKERIFEKNIDYNIGPSSEAMDFSTYLHQSRSQVLDVGHRALRG